MNKLICLIVCLLFFIAPFASAISPTGALYIQQVTSSSGYYSVKIHSKFPSNNYEVKGMPTKLPYLLERINHFIAKNLQDDNTAYVQFGYSDGQDVNHWFTTGPCHIPLPKDESISVTMDVENCHIDSSKRVNSLSK